MPWIDSDECTGCGTCVEECPAQTISMADGVAEIDMGGCIRCGTCHDICPQEAVKHDSERIPHEVEANVAMTLRSMEACAEHFGDRKERGKCLARMKKHFNKERMVAEKTIERLERLTEDEG